MGISDYFKAKEYKDRIAELESNEIKQKNRIAELEALLTPEFYDSISIKKRLAELQAELAQKEADIATYDKKLSEKKHQISSINKEYREKKQQLSVLDERLELEDFGIYKPRFAFTSVDEYKERLEQIRDIQKAMISNNTACTFSEDWTVDGSLAKGKKMTKGNIKMILRCFNCECDNAISAVKFSNYDRMVLRIEKSFELLNSLSETVKVAITPEYLKLKLDELTIAYEYERAKQEEKERIRELKEQEREQRALEREIEAERKRLQKEQNHYENALEKIIKQLEKAPDDPDLLQKKTEIENNIADTEKAIQDVDYREANRRAGYVYVISNIGAFGEGVYKIGMTRRLDPQERIDELGDASVPFRFDVHAMIFSEDAPALEAALHKAFESRRLNKVNTRREFFKVSLAEIKEVVKANYSKTTEFIEIPEAEQYRTSLKMQ